MIRFLTILLLSVATANAAIPIIFLRPGTNAVIVVTNWVETDYYFAESEDFDTGDGVFFPSSDSFGHSFNVMGFYSGVDAIEGSDFQSASSAGNVYRVGTGFHFIVDTDPRPPPVVLATDYTITNFASGDWTRHSRTWGPEPYNGVPTNYYVYARLSDHGSAANMVVGLHDVTSSTNYLGAFSTNTSGDGAYVYVPLKRDGTNVMLYLASTYEFRTSCSNDAVRFQRLKFAALEPTDLVPQSLVQNPAQGGLIHNPETGQYLQNPEL